LLSGIHKTQNEAAVAFNGLHTNLAVWSYLQIGRCMILIGIGSNISGNWGTPRATVRKAIATLRKSACKVLSVSSIVETAPFGNTKQPNFINAVVRIATKLDPESLLQRLQQIEKDAGRKRGRKWGPRTLDLDILDYNGLIRSKNPPLLPHPGLAQRQFVLGPIAEIAPRWRHPQSDMSAAHLLQRLACENQGAILSKLSPAVRRTTPSSQGRH
jgi:2-amino-4-hydroxy-6-hydroxymethyldihydropteridine diphosphokinase